MSHLSTRAQDAQPMEEEDIPESEPHPASPPPIPPTDPYSTLLTFVNQLILFHTQLCEDFYSIASHFTASQRYVKMHLTQIQNHLGYQMPPPTQYMHPFPHMDLPFPLYDPWPTPTLAPAVGNL